MATFKADAFSTAIVELKGEKERFALVMEHEDLKLYFVIERNEVAAIVTDLVTMVRYDA